ncbi:MAG: hypothetical protein IJD33_00805 [Clostridia bacterium]|nr:hypothetical protein [Clostridia bacterium]
MKQYQPCEVRIHKYDTNDVVRTSTPQANGVTGDYFTDENWYEQGGQNS